MRITPRSSRLAQVAVALTAVSLALAAPPPVASAATATTDLTAPASPTVDCPACVADVAIYDESWEDDGVWEEEVTALMHLAAGYGWSTRTVSASAITAGELGVGAGRRYRMFAAPGGFAATRAWALTPVGDQALRDFVTSGGGFVGFCAGAYWAADTVSFATMASGRRGQYNAARDYRSYPYDLGLFSGVAKGPFGWEPWAGGARLNYQRVRISRDSTDMRAAAAPARMRLLYGGGPFFQPSATPPDWQVWATAVAPSGTSPKASTGRGAPTIIRFRRGSGTVVLFAYHPAILVHSRADGVRLNQYYREDKIHWNRGGQSFARINADSRNIVHAAFDAAMGIAISPA